MIGTSIHPTRCTNHTPITRPTSEQATPNQKAVLVLIPPAGRVPLPPENGVRSVWRSMPVRMSLHSLKMLTAMCNATRPTAASRVRGHEKDPSHAAAAAPLATRVGGNNRKGARATPAKEPRVLMRRVYRQMAASGRRRQSIGFNLDDGIGHLRTIVDESLSNGLGDRVPLGNAQPAVDFDVEIDRQRRADVPRANRVRRFDTIDLEGQLLDPAAIRSRRSRHRRVGRAPAAGCATPPAGSGDTRQSHRPDRRSPTRVRSTRPRRQLPPGSMRSRPSGDATRWPPGQGSAPPALPPPSSGTAIP